MASLMGVAGLAAFVRPVWSQATDAPAIKAILEAAHDAPPLDGRIEAAPGKRPPGAILHQAALQVVHARLMERHGEADRVLSQEVRALDDLQRAANLLVERLREWAALHAPEAVRAVDDAARLAKLVAADPAREALHEAIAEAGASADSSGAAFADADMTTLKAFATSLEGLYAAAATVEARVHALMDEVAPNLASVTGPMVGARLIALAGSLERLATMPAGTIQLLGAETALFRHIKEKTKPPKHGVLYLHPRIHQAPPWHRGSAARAFANAAAVAAKADAFTKNDIKEELARRFEEDMARVAKRPRPAPRKPESKPYRTGSGKGPGGGKGGPGGPGGKGPGKKGSGKSHGFGERKPGVKPPRRPGKGRLPDGGPARPPGRGK